MQNIYPLYHPHLGVLHPRQQLLILKQGMFVFHQFMWPFCLFVIPLLISPSLSTPDPWLKAFGKNFLWLKIFVNYILLCNCKFIFPARSWISNVNFMVKVITDFKNPPDNEILKNQFILFRYQLLLLLSLWNTI